MQQKKHRKETGLFLAEGVKLVATALGNDLPIERLFFSKNLPAWERTEELLVLAKAKNIECCEINERIMRKISSEDNPQAVCAVCKIPLCDLPQVFAGEKKCIVVLDGLQDPGNVGTIIRTADASGAAGVLACSGSVDIFNPKTVRAAMGSSFYLPCLEAGDIGEVIAQLKAAGYSVVYTAADGLHKAHEYLYPEKLAIIIGNEGNGVSQQAVELCDTSLSIPIWGKAESLNASIAASVIIYQYAFSHNT